MALRKVAAMAVAYRRAPIRNPAGGTRPATVALAVALLGLVLAFAAADWVKARNARFAADHLGGSAGRIVAQIEARLARYHYGLRGARGAVVASGETNLSSAVFHRYSLTRDNALEFPGARGFGFIRRVAQADLAGFLRDARADAGEGFTLHELSPNAGEHFIIQYVEPVAPNRAALGLDVASEPERRAAAIRAMDTGSIALTRPITLVQAPAQAKTERGFLAFLPILAANRSGGSIEDRRAATIGWSYVALVIDEVLAGLDSEGHSYAISDVTSGPPVGFFVHGRGNAGSGDGPTVERRFLAFDRTWKIDVRAGQAAVKEMNRPLPLVVGAITALLGFLCAGLSHLALVGRQREIMAAAQNSRLAAIVENADEAILGKALDGTVTDWNPAAERLFGYPASLAIGRKAADLIFPAHLRGEEAETLAAIGRGEPVPAHATLRNRRDGGIVHVLASASPIYGAGGVLVGAASLMRDIGERVAHEEGIASLNASLERQVVDRTAELRAVVAAQSAILEHAGSAIIATDVAGIITVFNPAAERMLGYTAAEVIGRTTPMLFHDEDEVVERARRLTEEYGEVIPPGPETFVANSRRGKPDHDEWTFVAKSGERLPVLLNVAELRSPSGDALGYLGIAMDLSERHRHAAEMRAANAGTWSYDITSGRVRFSAECARQHGLPDVETEIDVETEWTRLAHPDDVAPALEALREAVASDGICETEFRVRLPGGHLRWLMIIGRVEMKGGLPTGRVIGLTLDITARKETEHALIEARQEAERANQAKSDFLATMSHEIRTPLNAIVGFTDLMLGSGRLERTERRQAELVRSAGSALLTVVNDILDFARIEAGAVILDPSPFSPEALADNCISIVRSLAEQKGLTLRLELDPRIPPALVGDKPRLRQILLNLLNNAVKFTDGGTVTLRVTHEGSDPEGEALRFAVTDTGIGIREDKRDRLFKRFSQVDASIEREFGGTGLGLAICKALVGLMGGEIGVESHVKVGSTFWFTLRLPRSEPLQATPYLPARAAGRGARLLLVEDNAVNQELALTVLERAGHSVVVAADGVQAINAVTDRTFDLILMDVQMPGMDGLSATGAIRALPGEKGRIPILAMSANVLPSEIRRCREAGMDDHIGKPFDEASLLGTIDRWLPVDRPADPAVKSGAAPLPFGTLARHMRPERLQHVLSILDDDLERSFAGPIDRPEDRCRLRFEAHSLTSAAAMVGLTHLSQACRELDEFDEDRIAARGLGAFEAALAKARRCASAARNEIRQAQEDSGQEHPTQQESFVP